MISQMSRPTILYHFDFWDRPLSGIAVYQGQKVYFKVSVEGGYTGHFRKEDMPQEIIDYLNNNDVIMDGDDACEINIKTDNYELDISIYSNEYPDDIIKKIINCEFDGFGNYFLKDAIPQLGSYFSEDAIHEVKIHPYITFNNKRIYIIISLFEFPWYSF